MGSVTVTAAGESATVTYGTVAATPGLWFKLPDNILNHPKKVFAHYFGPYPRSMDNKARPDYYDATYNNPSAQWGGMLRTRPIYRAPLGSTWRTDDCTFDVTTAVQAGIDGFVVDLLGQSGSNWDNYMSLLTAAQTYNTAHKTSFYVVPMLDTNGNTYLANKTNPTSAANSIAQFAGKNTSFYRDDGAFVFSTFKAEGAPLSWYQQMIAALSTQIGKPVAFMASFLDISQAPNYAPVTWTEGLWGYGGDPAAVNSATDCAAAARARGKGFFAPVEGQNVRPDQLLFDEAANTEAERASWEKVITQNADFVQIVTWSDFSEGTQYVPNEARGYAPLDLASWYITAWKTGSYPAILKDNVILSHRPHPVAVTGPRSDIMVPWNRGHKTTTRDTVEALTFLTEPSTVTITVAGQGTTYDAPAGMFARTVPLGLGPISAAVRRGGALVTSVASTVTPVANPVRQDTQYFWFSALRGTTGQKATVGP